MKAIITVGLGFGDEGKGSVVDYLTREHNAKLVVRYNGGCQAAHNVVLPDGRHHCFSQFGSGTLAGADTYLGRNVIIDPIGIKTEAESLYNNFDLKPNVHIHCQALVTTYYHMLMNKMKEASYKHGSCGLGIGETRKYWLDYGNDAIIAKDLRDIYVLRDKLNLLKQRFLAVQEYWEPEAKKYLDQIYELNVNNYARMLHNIYVNMDLVWGLPFNNVNDTVIFEGAQGVLLDEYYGFHPHTTWSTTTSLHAEEEIDNITSDIEIIGITRSYHTRHGNGPFPTEMYNIGKCARKYLDIKDYSFSMKHERNNKNEFQGNFRHGVFDLALFQYALKCQNVHSVFVTCLDDYRKDVIYNHNYSTYYKLEPSITLSNYLNCVDYDHLNLRKTEDILRVISKEVDISHISTGPTYKDKKEYV